MCSRPEQIGTPVSDTTLSNLDISEIARVNRAIVCDQLDVGTMSVGRLVVDSFVVGPIDSDEASEGPGIDITNITPNGGSAILHREIEAGVNCGTGDNTIIFDGNGTGANPSPSGNDAVCIGVGSSSLGNSSISIGRNAATPADNCVVVGANSSTQFENNVIVGSNSITGNSANNVVVGGGCNVSSANNVVLGYDTALPVGCTNNVVAGNGNVVTGDGFCVVMGTDNVSAFPRTVVVGTRLTANADSQVLFGNDGAGDVGVVGRVHFFGREPAVTTGGALPATADNFLTLDWNSALYTIPVFTSVPP